MKAGSFITKQESRLLQGIAVCLMVFHHLFAFPERIGVPFSSVLDFSSLHIETLVSYFGRLCVAIFAFNSGYGMRKRVSDLNQYNIFAGYKDIVYRLWNFAKRFWAIFIVFIGLGLFMGIYQWRPIQLLKSLFGLSYQYNAEWWYIGEYIRLLALFPIWMTGLKFIEKLRNGHLIHGGLLIILLTLTALLPEYCGKPYIICFLCGIFFATVPIYEWLDGKFSKYPSLYCIVSFCVLGGVFLSRTILLSGKYDYIHVPFFVFGFIGFPLTVMQITSRESSAICPSLLSSTSPIT